jgi:hypothetical protein
VPLAVIQCSATLTFAEAEEAVGPGVVKGGGGGSRSGGGGGDESVRGSGRQGLEGGEEKKIEKKYVLIRHVESVDLLQSLRSGTKKK